MKATYLILLAASFNFYNCGLTGPKPKVKDTSARVEKAPADSGEVISEQDSVFQEPGDSIAVPEVEETKKPLEASAQDSLVLTLCGISMPTEKSKAQLEKALSCAEKLAEEPDIALKILTLSESKSHNPKWLLKKEYLLGKSYLAQGKVKEAAKHWNKLQDIEPEILAILEAARKNKMVSKLMSKSLSAENQSQIENLMQAVIRGAHHPEISKIAVSILETNPPEDIRTEIKKLVQDTWEQDILKSQLQIKELEREYEASQNLELFQLKLKKLKMEYAHLPQKTFDEAYSQSDHSAGNSPLSDPESSFQKAESLVEKGRITEALPILDGLKGSPYESRAVSLKNAAGERFCIEKRKKASEYFAAKKGQSPQKQKELLDKAAKELENCLTYFNDIEIAKKVRKNLKMIKDQITDLAVE